MINSKQNYIKGRYSVVQDVVESLYVMMVFLFPSTANAEDIKQAVVKVNKKGKEKNSNFKCLTVNIGPKRNDTLCYNKIKNDVDLGELRFLKNRYNMKSMKMNTVGSDYNLTLKFKTAANAEAAKVYIKKKNLYGVDPL